MAMREGRKGYMRSKQDSYFKTTGVSEERESKEEEDADILLYAHNECTQTIVG